MRLSVAVAVVCLSIVGFAAADDVRAAVRKPTNIPAESLGAALQQLAKDRNFQIVYVSEEVNSLRTEGAVGEFNTEEALKQLLKGTGMTYRYLDEKTVTILPASMPSGTGGSAPQSPRSQPTSSTAGEAQSEGQDSIAQRFLLAQTTSGRLPSSTVVESQRKRAEVPEVPLQEVIVSAQKRPERLIDTPVSVSVISADELTSTGANQFRDYARSVPGLNILTNGAGDMIVSMRGVTVGTDVGPTVGIYVDDVPYGSSSSLTFAYTLGLDLSPLDLERIEVLKGPQGTLYGASSMGGAIKYITPRPSTDAFFGSAQAGVSGTQDGATNYDVAAAANVPIASTLALRASGFESHDGGYIDNVARDENNVNRSDVYGGRVDLLFTPSEALSIRVNGLLQDIGRAGLGDATYTLAGAKPYGSLGQFRPTAEPFHQQFRLFSGTIDYNFDWASLTSITSYQSTRTDWRIDTSALLGAVAQRIFGQPFGGISSDQHAPNDKFVQEVRLSSERSKPLQWVVGGFYTHESSSLEAQYLLFDQMGVIAPYNLSTVDAPETFEEAAAFGTVTWSLTDAFDIAGGIRYAHDRDQATQNGSGVLSGSRPTATSSDDVATYLADARYHFTPNATAYFRYATGYRPGGPNYVVLNPATGLPVGPPSFKPDSIRSYELGFKSETDDKRFAIELAGFLNDWTDIQAFSVQGSVAFRANGSAATTQGVEASFVAQPLDSLKLSGNLAYVHAYLTAASADLHAPEGAQLPTTPHFTTNWSGDYYFSEAALRPFLGMTYQYVSSRPAVFGSTYTLPDYETVDLHAGLTLRRVKLELHARNVLDARGQLSAYISGSPRVAIIEPRTVGLTASTAF